MWMITVPAILVLGFASGWISGSGNHNAWFASLNKPWFMPPGWVFPVVWTTLYVLMGVALAKVIAADSPWRGAALALFGVQLLLNLAWSPVFFGAHQVKAALAIILLLDVAVVATILAFARIAALPALLLLPYLAWLALATALNTSILRLNG